MYYLNLKNYKLDIFYLISIIEEVKIVSSIIKKIDLLSLIFNFN